MFLNNKTNSMSMPVRMFRGGNFRNTHEREQINRIIPKIIELYGKSENSWCTIFLNVVISGREFDCLIIKEDKIIILECKDLSGNIVADLGNPENKEPEKWTIISEGQDPYILEEGKIINGRIIIPPCLQVRWQRGAIVNLLKKILPSLYTKKDPDEIQWESYKFVSGFVVVNNDTEISIENYDRRKRKWFKIISEDNVPNNILNQTSYTQIRIQTQLLERIVEEMKVPGKPGKKVKEIPPDIIQKQYWFLEDIDSISSWNKDNVLKRKIRFDKLDEALKSKSEYEIEKAIEIIDYLELIEYIEDIKSLRKSSSPKIRYLALEKIVQIDAGIQLTKFLLDYVNDEYRNIRKKAFEYLVLYGSNIATEKMIEILNDTKDRETAMDVIEVLKAIGDERATSSLIQFANDYSNRFKDYIMDIDSRYSEEVKNSIIKSEINFAIQKVMDALGEIGGSNSISFCKKYLFDEDKNLKDYAIKALGNSGNREAVRPLLEILENEKEWWIIGNIIQALGNLKDQRSSLALCNLLDYNKSNSNNIEKQYVQKSAIEALKNIGAKESFDPLFYVFVKMITTGDIIDQYNIAGALAHIDATKFEKELLKLLNTMESKYLRFIGRWLSLVCTINSIDILIPFLSTDDTEAKDEFTNAIMQAIQRDKSLKGTVPDNIVKLLTSDNNNSKESAADIIAVIEKENGIDKLLVLEHDGSLDMKCTFIRVLGLTRSKRALYYIFKYINDPDLKSQAFFTLSFMAHDKIGKNYAQEKGVPVPEDVKDNILRDGRDVEIHFYIPTAAFYWGEAIIDILLNGISETNIEKNRTILYTCQTIGNEKCRVILEKLMSLKGFDDRHLAEHFYRKIIESK